SKHKFHPRPDSPLHLPNEEPVLGYLKFSAKRTRREVFGMPIPGNLITADIQGEPYYKEYLEKSQNWLHLNNLNPNLHQPSQMWIEEECKYDIAAMYGIFHWWFQRQRFYIDRHTSEGYRRAVRTYMRILNVVKIEVFSMYGYDYMKKIVLRRADLNEYIIAERDFKYMYPSDFEDLYLLNLQGHLNYLPPKDKKILTTAVKHGPDTWLSDNA
nr:E-beta-farnesene synthase [Tanacetum cinerariifolium]